MERDDKMSHSSFHTLTDNLKNRQRTIFGDYWHKEKNSQKELCASTDLDKINIHPNNCNNTLHQGHSEVTTSNKCSKSEMVATCNKTHNKVRPLKDQPMKIKTSFCKTEGRRSVRFDPRICVREFYSFNQESHDDQGHKLKRFDNSGWFTNEELQMFKVEAVYVYEHINKLSRSLSSGEEKDSRRSNEQLPPYKSFFNNPALKVSNGDHVLLEGTEMLSQSLANHIRKILVVESDACYQKQIFESFSIMFPDASIVGFDNADEALKRMSSKGLQFSTTGSNYDVGIFDIIVIDERLKHTESPRIGLTANRPSSPVAVAHSHEDFGKHHECISAHGHIFKSGSNLMQAIKSLYKFQSKIHLNSSPCAKFARENFGWREPLFIGVSSFLSEDSANLTRGGADFLWGNPLPLIDRSLRNTIFTLLLEKRGLSSVIC